MERRHPARTPAQSLRSYAESLLMVAAATGVGLLIAPRWGNAPVDLLYLVPVMVAASFFGFAAGLLSAIASALAYNYFFTQPLHSFRIHSPADVVTVVMLLTVALMVGRLAAALRAQARIAAQNANRNATIAGFAGRLLSCMEQSEIGSASCGQIADLFACNAVLLIERDGQPVAIASQPPRIALTPGDYGAAALAFAEGDPIGRGSPRLSPADWLFYPVKSGGNVLAAIGVARDDGRPPVGDAQLPLFTNLLDQVALALERDRLERQMQDVERLRERDRLRGALLSSVGHDLRTPLTAIVAAASELRQARVRPELVETIEMESDKLGRYIANLLDMARIEAGAIRLHEEPVDLVDAVAAALRDLKQPLAGRTVAVDLPADLPLVRADPHLLHHMLLNLIDNAARYSPADTSIAIIGRREPDDLTLAVTDRGPGLPEPPAALLDRFTLISGSDRKGGAGLGLAIVNGFAQAMGIGLDAINNEAGGATFMMRFAAPLLVSEDALEQGL